MRTVTAVLVLAIPLSGCGRSRPTYQLVIDQKTVDLVVYEDPKLIQDDLTRRIKQVWDELTTGDSPTFYWQRVIPLDIPDLEPKLRAKYGDSVRWNATGTCKCGPYRFFKDRDGVSGFELVDEEKPYIELFLPNPAFPEERLQQGILSLQLIRDLIQHAPSQPLPGKGTARVP